MNNKEQIFEETYEAKCESKVAAAELIKEILPLLEDYFVGDFLYDGNTLTYVMPNGQRFNLKAEEIA
ncbi:MAG: hypothetical protein ACI4L9_02355 [Candidatus Coproplasma sp.]